MTEKWKNALGLNRPRLTLSIICIIFVIHLVFPRYLVATGSMVPAMPPGSYVVAFRTGAVSKGDVAVFKPVEGVSPRRWVHRIVAVSGEEITPPDRAGRVDIAPGMTASHSNDPTSKLLVPQSHYYQSGDSDTSYHGLVPEDAVIGKVIFHFKLPWR